MSRNLGRLRATAARLIAVERKAIRELRYTGAINDELCCASTASWYLDETRVEA